MSTTTPALPLLWTYDKDRWYGPFVTDDECIEDALGSADPDVEFIWISQADPLDPTLGVDVEQALGSLEEDDAPADESWVGYLRLRPDQLAEATERLRQCLRGYLAEIGARAYHTCNALTARRVKLPPRGEGR